jgi:arylamine N-acetyltransferase
MASAYSESQLHQYLDYIGLPKQFHPRNHSPKLDLSFLTLLHMHQITSVPYENLSLHYSPTHTITLNPQHLFSKIVTADRGRGGYCMETSIFFNHILRALGFRVYTAGAKIRYRDRATGVPAGKYIGWVHIVNIVTLTDEDGQEKKYMVDVAFGGDGATKPIPLDPTGETITHNSIGTQEIRLVHDFIPDQSRESPLKMWMYQYRNAGEKPWNSFYAFYDAEFLEPDFAVMNWYTGTHPESFQTFTVLVVKFLRVGSYAGEQGQEMDGVSDDRIIGKIMLIDGVIKRNVSGQTEVVKICRNEEERIEALEEYFEIVLTNEEKRAIRGRNTDLDAKKFEATG